MKKALIFTFIFLIQLIPIYASGWQELLPDWVRSNRKLESADGNLVFNRVNIVQESGQFFIEISGVKFKGKAIKGGLVFLEGDYYDLSGTDYSDTIIPNSAAEISGSYTSIDNSIFNGYVTEIFFQPINIESVYPDWDVTSFSIQRNEKIYVPLPIQGDLEVILLLDGLIDDDTDGDVRIGINLHLQEIVDNEQVALNELFPGSSRQLQEAYALGCWIKQNDKTTNQKDFHEYVTFITDNEYLNDFDESQISNTILDDSKRDILKQFLDKKNKDLAKAFDFYKDDDLENCTPFYRFDSRDSNSLYNYQSSFYTRYYLNFLLFLGKPLFSSYYTGDNTYNFREYEPISSSLGNRVALNALRYTNWGVEYMLQSDTTPDGNRIVFNSINDKNWFNTTNSNRNNNYLPFEPHMISPSIGDTPYDISGEGEQSEWIEGNPIPYTPLGIDSPRTFAWKMDENQNTDATTFPLNNDYTKYDKYRPGNVDSSYDGYDQDDFNPSNSAGVDPVGFLVGVASMSEIDLVKKNNVSNPASVIDGVYRNLNISELNFQYYENSNHRISGSDLELTSILVPSLHKIQKGDFLVKYDEYGYVSETAFIIGTPDIPQLIVNNVRDLKDYIPVVAISRELGRVTRKYWGQLEDDQNFQIRRFLNDRSGSNAGERTVGWEVVDSVPYYIESFVDFYEDKKEFDQIVFNQVVHDWGAHYVPNTDDPLVLKNIFFKITNKAGDSVLDYTGREIELEMLIPKDPYFDPDKEDDEDNIFNNKGSGNLLIFGYIDEVTGEPVPLSTLTKNDSTYAIENGGLGSYFAKSYYFSDSDERFNENDKDTVFKLIYKTDNETHSKFYVQAVNARPGNDYILNFGLKEYGSVFTDPEDDDMNFLAVYDKKMLWRANLYIDEGVDDWNNLHPWIAGNEWFVTQENGAFNDGGQINLSAWTRYYDGINFPLEAKEVADAAPYTTGGSDTPFSMNDKLNEQKDLISYYYSNENLMWTLDENPNPEWGGWAFTTAPDNDWSNYLSTYINSNNYPYRPGYSSVQRYGASGTGYLASQVDKSVGADCSGYVQRVCSYNNSIYTVPNLSYTDGKLTHLTNIDTWTQGGVGSRNLLEGTGGIRNASIEIPETRYLVPGDIVNLDGHSVIINKISVRETREVDYDEVFVIESTGRPLFWKVANSMNLEEINEWYANSVILGRLNVTH